MGSIEYSRVLTGGLRAGVVIAAGESVLNALILAAPWKDYIQEHALPDPGAGIVTLYLLLCMIIGLAIVFLYALMRPRCGAGPRTALLSGLFTWFLLWLANFGIAGIAFGIPIGMILFTLIWGLVEVSLASLLGGWSYRED